MAKFGSTLVTRILRADHPHTIGDGEGSDGQENTADSPANQRPKLGEGPISSLLPESEVFEFTLEKGAFIVDKSLLAVDLEATSRKTLVFSLPPGWGKSWSLGMLRYFYDVQLNPETYQPLADVTDTPPYKFFLNGEMPFGGAKLERKLSIAADVHQQVVTRNLGQWPTIHVDFDLATSYTYEGVIDSVSEAISNLYEKHSYLTALLEKVVEEWEAEERAGSKRISTRTAINDAKRHLAKFNRILNREGDSTAEVGRICMLGAGLNHSIQFRCRTRSPTSRPC